MTAQTPLKAIAVAGSQVFTLDYAEIATLVCLGANEDQTYWLAESLAAYHGVKVIKVGGLLAMKVQGEPNTGSSV